MHQSEHSRHHRGGPMVGGWWSASWRASRMGVGDDDQQVTGERHQHVVVGQRQPAPLRQDPRLHQRLERPMPRIHLDKDRRPDPHEGEPSEHFKRTALETGVEAAYGDVIIVGVGFGCAVTAGVGVQRSQAAPLLLA